MAISPICSKCQSELDEPGAILLGPPNEEGQVQKFHLCLACYGEVAEWLKVLATLAGPKMDTLQLEGRKRNASNS